MLSHYSTELSVSRAVNLGIVRSQVLVVTRLCNMAGDSAVQSTHASPYTGVC